MNTETNAAPVATLGPKLLPPATAAKRIAALEKKKEKAAAPKPKKAPAAPKTPARKFSKKEEGMITTLMAESKCTRARAIKAMDDAAAHAAKLAPKPDPALAKLEKDLARSKERLAKPKAPAKAAPKKAAPKKPSGTTYKTMAAAHTGASTIDHPVKAMWDLCDKMKDAKRKDVIAAAVDLGVGYYTARTQYQLWLTAFRNS